MAWSIDDAEIAAEQPVTASLMTRLRNGGIETDVQMMARQNAAPLGWTKVESNVDNRAIRLFSGAPSDGGSVDFSTVFGRTATDGHANTRQELPNYTLPDTFSITGSQAGGLVRNLSIGNPAVAKTQSSLDVSAGSQGPFLTNVFVTLAKSWSETSLGLGGSVTLGGSGQAHSHPMDNRVRYIGMCLFQKA